MQRVTMEQRILISIAIAVAQVAVVVKTLSAQTPLEARLKAAAAAADSDLIAPKQLLDTELLPARGRFLQQLDRMAEPSAEMKSLERALKESVASIKATTVATLHTRAQFDEYDRLTRRRDETERALDLAKARHRAAAFRAAAESESGRMLLKEIAQIEERISAASTQLDAATATALVARNRLKVYTSPPPPPGKIAGDGGPLKIQPPGDVAERAKRFASRNSPENLAALSREFFARVDVKAKGLESVPALLASGRHAQALEVWRDAFFARLREPRKHGLPANWGGDLDTASLLRVPAKDHLDEAMRGIFSTPRAKAHVGEPGTIHWGDPGPDPGADPARNPYLDFYTMRGQGGFVDVLGPHRVLLDGYAATGERSYLERWAAVLDDWAMNAPRDMEASPFNIRQYPVLCSFKPVALASTLTDVLEAQPDFARDLPAATLARIMLAVMEEYPPAFVRLARRGIYNWRCIAMTGSLLTAQVFSEFHTARWQLDEAKRLMELNWSHKILRDGGNLEQGNWGHEPNDQVHLGRAYRLLATQPPAWMDDAWRAEWRDNVKVNARYYLHAMKPDGFSYRFSRVTTADKFVMRGRFDDDAMPIQTNLLMDEAESRRRLEWVFGEYPLEKPRVDSESLAYLGASIFRQGWEPSASFLYFQCNPNRDCNGREDANGFALHAHGHAMLLAPPLAVDDRTQNVHHGLVADPGGKTIWLTYDHRGVPVSSRFHASAKFDFTEGEYRGVYQWQSGPEAEMFGDYGYVKLADKLRPKGDEPIRDAAHARQVLSVRGEDLVIVTDRFRSDQARKFSQNYTLYTPVPREGWKRRVELAAEEKRPPLVVDAQARVLATDNHLLPSVSLRHFGGPQPTYTITDDAFGKIGEADTSDEALAAMGSSKLKKWTMGLPLPFSKKVRLDWTTKGEQLVVTAIATRPGEPGGRPLAGDLRDVQDISRDGVTGFRATTRLGTRIEYIAGARPATVLRLGKVEMEGEALLLTTRGEQISGIALGCARWTCDGKASDIRGDFEFSLSTDSMTSVPIHRPIQPVTIEPQATAFTNSVRVTLACPTPGVDIHYTVDGSDPTLESPRYREPLTLTSTTRVKARAIRTGLVEMPWTADGTHATAMTWTTFEKQPLRSAVAAADLNPGLTWEYIEGRWPQLLADVERMPARKTGVSEKMLEVSMRETDGAFAIRASGFLTVPADGVYTIHAPSEWQLPDGESGYDIRIYLDDRPWQPATRRHAHGDWSIALAKGAHPLRVVFVDMRPRKLKPELWNNFPNPGIVWKAAVPTLTISGPGIEREAIKSKWLSH